MKILTCVSAVFAAALINCSAYAQAPQSSKAQPGLTKSSSSEKTKTPTKALPASLNAKAEEKVAPKSVAKAKGSPVKKTALTKKTELDLTQTKSKDVKAVEKPGVRYGTIVARYAASYGIPASLAHAVIKVESNYRPGARGKAGEIGLMQIKPATARMMGYTGSVKGLFNPETNIKYGMKYLAKAHSLGGGTTCGTILKYNAGHAAKRMNPVSSAYCGKVKQHLAAN
jgi:soluble lytic murein transglycosylase-like protein